ncbi:MAG: DUF1343 domain-containing protein [Candidatus Delongbacteria bacterium]|nr:DUF1343 domain-containing protein [Candidatus Delongbacteria bacterium]
MSHWYWLSIIVIGLIGQGVIAASPRVTPGIDVFIRQAAQDYKGKTLGLISNPTGVTADLQSDIDVLVSLNDPKLIKLFGPEHGLRGDAYAGDRVDDMTDPVTGLPIYSLYGKNHKPTREMLQGVDVLLYDIQDIGSRGYTYIYTMALAMEAAAENGIEFVVLDRPSAMRADIVDGNILDPEFKSFIGMYPIAYVYGMTPGELAMYFNREFKLNAKLRVIKMEGYTRNMDYSETGLAWIPPSPHIPRSESAYFCAATGCMGELRTVSEGVGYTLPFELCGAEWIDGRKLASTLNQRRLPGVIFRPLVYKPYYGPFQGKNCSGVQLILTSRAEFRPFVVQIHLLQAIHQLWPDQPFLGTLENAGRKDMFEKAAGTDQIRRAILQNQSAEQIIAAYTPALNQFLETRRQYLLYP